MHLIKREIWMPGDEWMHSRLNKINKIRGHDDILIYCAGFEKRSLGVLNKFSKYSFTKAFLLKYKNTVDTPSAKQNEIAITKKLSSIGTVEEILVDPLNPIISISRMFQEIESENRIQPSISIDISVMSKFILMMILRGLSEYNLINQTKMYYTQPNDYDVASSKLSYGLGKIDVIPTFEGHHDPRAESLLLILLGYEGDRAFSLWEKMEPDECYLAYPSPPYKRTWADRTYYHNKEIIAAVGKNRMIPISSQNPMDASNAIVNFIKKKDSKMKKNFMIAPMGTKPQTLGVFRYYWNSKSFPTIIYSHPQSHDEYSSGIGNTYLLPFHLRI